MTNQKKIFLLTFMVLDILFISVISYKYVEFNSKSSKEYKAAYNMVETKPVDVVEEPKIVYDGMTLEELAIKLDRSLNSTISGKGSLIASHCMELGLDPYIAVAIMLHETGCNWECSSLVVNCNNVGGQKGSGCGAYQSFPTLDEGIIGFLDNLYYNYYSIGLTTPELMNPKYAESTTWATQVNGYIEQIKAR